jgi:tetratricopeptide (TPR) repeat protein
MVPKSLLLLCVTALLAAESVYFISRCTAGILRLKGEKAFFRNDHQQAWINYRRSLALGGDRETLETDEIELLLFGLDQEWAGVKVKTPLPPDEAVRAALDLAARRVTETPFKAYAWSLASDAYFHAARLRRRDSPLDLFSLSEDPMEILRREDHLGLAALETASRLEPNNYIYHDLLTEKFLELGQVDRAAEYCRKSVAAYPILGDHPYLLAPDLAPELLEAAVRGFEDSRSQETMIPRGTIECDAGDLLRRHGQERRALDFLKRAVVLSPNLYEAQYFLGVASFDLGDYPSALRHLQEAVRCLPESPSPHVHMGLAYMALGELQGAIDQFRQARAKDPRITSYFHLLGDALEKAGQIREAERQFVAAAKSNPESTAAWAYLLAFYTRHRDLRPLADACTNLGRMAPGEATYREQCISLGLETP